MGAEIPRDLPRFNPKQVISRQLIAVILTIVEGSVHFAVNSNSGFQAFSQIFNFILVVIFKKNRFHVCVHVMSFRALTLASPEVRFHIDSETHDPIDIQSKELRYAIVCCVVYFYTLVGQVLCRCSVELRRLWLIKLC